MVELETSSRRRGQPMLARVLGPARPFLPRREVAGWGRAVAAAPAARSGPARPCHAGLRDLCRHLPAHPCGRRALPLPGNGGGAERPDPQCGERAAAGSHRPAPSHGPGLVRASVSALAAPRAASGAGSCWERGCGLRQRGADRAGPAGLHSGPGQPRFACSVPL